MLLLGAGGFARETAELLRDSDSHELLGLLDDDPRCIGAAAGGSVVLGPLDIATVRRDAHLVACMGKPAARGAVVSRLGAPDSRYATLVHPSGSVARSVSVGVGTVIHAGVVCTADAQIGRHVAVMPQVVITHDDVVGDLVTLAAGVRLAGSVVVEAGAYVGAGALVREGVRIGAGAVVGMGAVVVADVPAGETWVGNPARPIRRRVTV